MLPLDAQEEVTGVEVWHHDSKTWKTVIGEGLTDDADDASHHSDRSWDYRWNEDYHFAKNRDGDIPEWDGKSEHRTTYFRRIDLWAATTGVPPKQRGCRLLQKLKGEAFEKLENVMPQTLIVEGSVEKFKECVIEVYEPIEDYRIGKIMDTFLDEFQRKNDQEIVDYNLAWAREVLKVEKVAGELQGKWKAHLFLKKMRLKPEHKSQVLTGALGNYTVEALQKAALTTFPSVKDAFRRGGGAHEGGNAYKTGRPPFRGRYTKNGRRKPPWRANEAHIDEEEVEDYEWEEDYPEEDDADSEEESETNPEPEEEGADECPQELEDAYVEAEAFL
ncbi:MAG: hypothetical protein QGH82_00470, partial [Candidatus Woesearchaeota archaeon]|nr:hypothetical protein [Candidatus Woesearchaeota archaeon]